MLTAGENLLIAATAAPTEGKLQELSVALRRNAPLAFILLSWWTLHLAQPIFLDSKNDLGSLSTSGNLVNQIQVISFAAVGALFIGPVLMQLKRKGAVWFYCLILYFIWSAVSLSWSNTQTVGFRRLMEFLLICIGAMGVGGYLGRSAEGVLTLLRYIWWGGVVSACLSLPLVFQDFSIQHLLNPNWIPKVRLEGPEPAVALAFAILSSLVTFFGNKVKNRADKGGLLTVFVIFVLLIFKSRSMILYTAAISLGVYLFARKKSREFIMVSLFGVALAIPMMQFMGQGLATNVVRFFSRGESSHTLQELNGRTPLWDFVWRDSLPRMWTGVGFGSYWTPSRLLQVWHEIGWKAPFAHNGYLEEFAATGIIGLVLFCLFVVFGMGFLYSRAKGPLRVPCLIAIGFLALFLALNATDSILQFYFKCPFFFSLALLTACSVAPLKIVSKSPIGR